MGSRIDYGYETWSEKFKRKFNENPWVPIGCLATTGALVMSAVKMKSGKSKDMQYWLRARVGLQGLTLVALVAGSMALQASRKTQGVESADDLPRNEATTELLREQKKGKEKAEFEERLRGAELAHEEEQAAAARVLNNSKSSGRGAASVDEPSAAQRAAAATSGAASSAKSGSSWIRWLGWGSSKADNGESNKKS
ncbi:hypothetical protein D9756_009784 [Leucocoprinus leucothites]|uniref:HIG1 domain-containing protein n=1 Tax=Leucocoprinus leucothites TaxID=201217 RepID=A0A8H5FTS9_9AGAR|nr:hypothetical protein D9756_009784 [Leucoagaricus leucothites]